MQVIDIINEIKNLSVKDKETFLLLIDDVIWEIKDELINNKDNLNKYEVAIRKNFKILTKTEELLNKYPYEQYKDYYKLSINKSKVLNELTEDDIEVVEETITYLKKKKLDNE